MSHFLRYTLCCLFMFLTSYNVYGAGLKNVTIPNLQDINNPQALQDDIMLPMPCGLNMAFRIIAIPVKNILWDTSFIMGSEHTAREGMEFYERPFETTLAAPFQQTDLPKAWHKALPNDTEYTYYLIGKYEVNNAQWNAVMQKTCRDTTWSSQSAQPKTAISWYDVQNFLLHYNQWLLDHKPNALPHFINDTRNKGFLRLPTEAEWEYAARGGHRVTKEWLIQEPFPPMAKDTTLSDYAIYRPSNATVIQENTAIMGSRRANPLGIHDMLGNVAEMVQDSFHFSLGGRLHGSAGGFIRKGGSFTGVETDIMPGRREEVAYFTQRGPTKTRDMGFRLVISGINTPGGDRQALLKQSWQDMGKQSASKTTQNAQNELTRLMATKENKELQAEFAKLQGLLKDSAIEQERQNSAIAEGNVRTALYMIETIRNYGVRHNIAVSRIQEVQHTLTTATKQQASSKNIQMLQQTLKAFTNTRQDQQEAMESAANFYKTKLDETSTMPIQMIDTHIKNISVEWQQNSLLAKNMRQNLKTFTKHLKAKRQNETKKLTKQALIKDILPKNLQLGLELS